MARRKVRDFVQGRIDRLTAELRQARDNAEQAAATTMMVLIGAAAAALLGTVALSALIVVFGITRPLGSLVGVLHRMAQGEIDAEITEATRGDEDPRTVENFTRVEAFGSPYVHWVRIGVDPRDRDVFSFHPEVLPENRLGGPNER